MNIGRTILSLLATQLATWTITIVTLIVVPKQLGADDFGRLQLAIAFVGFFSIVGALGTNAFLVRAIARDKSILGPYLANTIALKLCIAAVLSIAAMGLAAMFDYDARTVVLVAIALVGMTLSLVNDVLSACLAGLGRVARPAVWAAVQSSITGAIGLLLLVRGAGVVSYALVIALGSLIPVTAGLAMLWPHLTAHVRVDLTIWRAVVRGGIPLFVLSGLTFVYGTIDIPILKSMAGVTSVADYSLAYRWVSIPIFISTIVVSAFLPSLSALSTESPEGFTRLTNRALRLVFVVAIPASIGIILVAADLMTLLYGDEFSGAIVLMRILSIHIPIAAMDVVLVTALIASDRQGKYLVVAAIAALVTAPINVVAINIAIERWDAGAIGAAITTVAIELFITMGAVRYRHAGVLDRRTSLFGVRCLIAALLMVPVLLVLDDAGLFVKIVAGGLTYGAASLSLGTVSVGDLKEVVHRVRRHDGTSQVAPTPTEPST